MCPFLSSNKLSGLMSLQNPATHDNPFRIIHVDIKQLAPLHTHSVVLLKAEANLNSSVTFIMPGIFHHSAPYLEDAFLKIR
jgi:hypothetical protein